MLTRRLTGARSALFAKTAASVLSGVNTGPVDASEELRPV